MTHKTATAHITTNATAPAATPAKEKRTAERPAKDRRKDHPAPLTETDRAALATMPYVADAGDLDQIPTRYRSRAFTFLREFADGAKTKDAMSKAQMLCWEISYCRKFSQTFRITHDNLITSRREYATSIIEDTLLDLATGRFKPKDGCLPPEVRAASVLLPAYDAKYRNSGGTAQQVQINIAI